MMNGLIQKLTRVQHGFKPFEEEAQDMAAHKALSESKAVAIDCSKVSFTRSVSTFGNRLAMH